MSRVSGKPWLETKPDHRYWLEYAPVVVNRPKSTSASRLGALTAGLLELRPYPSVLVDASARIITTNRAARVILAEGFDWVEGPTGRLERFDEPATRILHEQIRKLAFSDDARLTSCTTQRLTTPGGESRFVVIQKVVTCNETCDQDCCNHERTILLSWIWHEARRFSPDAIGRLTDAFALSAPEMKLAHALIMGQSLASYAHARGLRLPIVRRRLRSILRKSGCAGRHEFVRLSTAILAA